jgi:hypothetical protein
MSGQSDDTAIDGHADVGSIDNRFELKLIKNVLAQLNVAHHLSPKLHIVIKLANVSFLDLDFNQRELLQLEVMAEALSFQPASEDRSIAPKDDGQGLLF